MTSNIFDATHFYIDETSTGQSIVTALSTLDTAHGGTNTYTGTANFFAIETRIHDRVDTDLLINVGLVVFDTNNVFVTTPVVGSTDSTIQRGIDAVPAPGTGWTVNVQAGTYKENVTVDRSVTLLGANAGTAGSASRVAETTVITNGNQSAIFYVTSSNVTINGFTINGDDPSVTGASVYSGEDANAAYGVTNFNGSTAAPIGNLTLANNIVENVAVGTRLQTNTADNTVSTGSQITNNWFHDIGNFDFGYAVSLRNNFYADVTGNLMTRVWTGIHLNNFSLAGGPASWNVSNNTIHSYAGGILYWLEFNAATAATFDHDQIALETTGVAAARRGTSGSSWPRCRTRSIRRSPTTR